MNPEEVPQLVRLKDLNRSQNPRNKCPSDSPSKQALKRERRKQESSRKKRGQIEFTCEKDEEKTILMNKLDHIKLELGGGLISKVTNYALLSQVMDYYIENNLMRKEGGKVDDKKEDVVYSGSYQYCPQSATTEPIFLCTQSAVDNLVTRLQKHSAACPERLTVKELCRDGHTGIFDVTCGDKRHSFHWYSSPRIEGGKFLVDARMAHGHIAAGIQPIQYQRLCDSSGIGKIGDTSLDSFTETYSKAVHQCAEESQKDALQEEIASNEILDDGISIMTDARHNWRKNARFSDVVCLGDISHKVLRVETISKITDDPCTQRHEILGTKRIYEYFDNEAVPINVHSHHNNASVIKFVREERKPTRNGNDTWHACKSLAKQFKKLMTDKKKVAGVSQLKDKAASIRTHVYWAMKTCEDSPEKLRANIDSIIPHYKYDHQHCQPDSRCRSDPMYEASKEKITSDSAEEVLAKFLKGLPMYKDAQNYCAFKNTHYVESFNNALLIYQDKRIGGIGQQRYRMNTELAILDWNEHIDRPRTSVTLIDDAAHPRRQTGRPVHSKKEYSFRNIIWDRWMSNLYPSDA